jgi:hypothetical protein
MESAFVYTIETYLPSLIPSLLLPSSTVINGGMVGIVSSISDNASGGMVGMTSSIGSSDGTLVGMVAFIGSSSGRY